MDISWLIGDFPPGMAMLGAIQVALLFAIWRRLQETAEVHRSNLAKILDRFEKSDMSHVKDHNRIEKAMEYLRARVNGGTK